MLSFFFSTNLGFWQRYPALWFQPVSTTVFHHFSFCLLPLCQTLHGCWISYTATEQLRVLVFYLGALKFKKLRPVWIFYILFRRRCSRRRKRALVGLTCKSFTGSAFIYFLRFTQCWCIVNVNKTYLDIWWIFDWNSCVWFFFPGLSQLRYTKWVKLCCQLYVISLAPNKGLLFASLFPLSFYFIDWIHMLKFKWLLLSLFRLRVSTGAKLLEQRDPLFHLSWPDCCEILGFYIYFRGFLTLEISRYFWYLGRFWGF